MPLLAQSVSSGALVTRLLRSSRRLLKFPGAEAGCDLRADTWLMQFGNGQVAFTMETNSQNASQLPAKAPTAKIAVVDAAAVSASSCKA